MKRKPNQFRAFLAITYYAFKAQTRNKSTFFFGFLFPLVFISIFGLIGNANPKVTIGIPSSSNMQNQVIQNVKQSPAITTVVSDNQTLLSQIKQGKIDGLLNVTSNQGANTSYATTLTTSASNPQNAAVVQLLVKGIVDQSNVEISGITTPQISFTITKITGRQSRYIDFALPGMIGFSLLSTAIFGVVFGLIFLKKQLVIKRMFATPMLPLTFLFGQGMSRLIIAIFQTILILVVGVYVFHFYLPHGFETFMDLMILSVFGLVAFLGFGYFMAGLANDENSANPMINLVTLPQFLLSGTFFPTSSLPSWVQPIATNLPLSYFNEAVRKITTEGGSLHDTIPYLLGLSVWGILMYVLAAKTFKWE